MEKGNFVYSGWRANGFVALVGLLVLIAGGIALCVFGSDVMDPVSYTHLTLPTTSRV